MGVVNDSFVNREPCHPPHRSPDRCPGHHSCRTSVCSRHSSRRVLHPPGDRENLSNPQQRGEKARNREVRSRPEQAGQPPELLLCHFWQAQLQPTHAFRSSLVAHWVEAPALSLLWPGCNPSGSLCVPQAQAHGNQSMPPLSLLAIRLLRGTP